MLHPRNRGFAGTGSAWCSCLTAHGLTTHGCRCRAALRSRSALHRLAWSTWGALRAGPALRLHPRDGGLAGTAGRSCLAAHGLTQSCSRCATLGSRSALHGLTGLARHGLLSGTADRAWHTLWTWHATGTASGALRTTLRRLHPRYGALTDRTGAGLTTHRLTAQSRRGGAALSTRALHRLTGHGLLSWTTGGARRARRTRLSRSASSSTWSALSARLLGRLHPRYSALTDGAGASLTTHRLAAERCRRCAGRTARRT